MFEGCRMALGMITWQVDTEITTVNQPSPFPISKKEDNQYHKIEFWNELSWRHWTSSLLVFFFFFFLSLNTVFATSAKNLIWHNGQWTNSDLNLRCELQVMQNEICGSHEIQYAICGDKYYGYVEDHFRDFYSAYHTRTHHTMIEQGVVIQQSSVCLI